MSYQLLYNHRSYFPPFIEMSSSSPIPQNPGLKRKRSGGGKNYDEYVRDTEADTSSDEGQFQKPKTYKKRRYTPPRARSIVGGCCTTDIRPDNVEDVPDIKQISEEVDPLKHELEMLNSRLKRLIHKNSMYKEKLKQYKEAKMIRDIFEKVLGEMHSGLQETKENILRKFERELYQGLMEVAHLKPNYAIGTHQPPL